MDTWLWILIAAFVLVDLAATVVVLRIVARRRRETHEDPREAEARRMGLG